MDVKGGVMLGLQETKNKRSAKYSGLSLKERYLRKRYGTSILFSTGGETSKNLVYEEDLRNLTMKFVGAFRT